ncbi:MAG: 2-amino-4-hydroxy-6-hydroxymethyldihydropteridine diphosphokinase [Flavobacteriaceae bacterium]|nr:2-amino-4-hydroxy-6-hydroxymethyldihydropteridine diphosphokinase [Flavobacteriaceae bacterium]
MKPLQNIYLSLGSNLGNKFENLQTAIDLLFQEIGAIDKISSVYQTPALGFVGEDFYNCVVLLKSDLTPTKILKKILRIEKQLGRVRNKETGYSSRTIDIDILLVDDLEIETENLVIPHPELPNRKFVLQPLAELNNHIIHPKLQKNVVWLLAKTTDQSDITKLSKWLKNPKNDYSLSAYKYIAIEGNIGAGKTSLAQQMSLDFNAKLILERFKENPFLPKFYEEPQRYAFPLEMSFLADRYQQLVEDITQYDLFKDCVVADYDVYKSMIFAKITLTEEEFTLYRKLFNLMHKELAKPDLYVYLYQTTERLLENIKKRGRKFEQSIEAAYLKKINEGYLDFIKSQHTQNVKLIDVSDRDFVMHRKDYLSVLKEIIG